MKELVIFQHMFGAGAGLTQRVLQTGINPQQLVVPVSTQIVSRNMKIGILAIDRSGVATLTLAITQCSTCMYKCSYTRSTWIAGYMYTQNDAVRLGETKANYNGLSLGNRAFRATSALSPAFDIDDARLASRTNYAPYNILVTLINFLMLGVCSESSEIHRQQDENLTIEGSTRPTV
jgi:hypothetical protein